MYLIFYCSISIVLCSNIVKSQESCMTPEHDPGTCISINECKYISDLIKDAPKPLSPFFNKFLEKRLCRLPGIEIYICCSSNHTSTPGIQDVSNHPNLNLLPTSCGIISDNRVSNGENTTLFELPFMALLRYYPDSRQKFGCGGTIINKRYILTAAHCVVGAAVRLVSVRVGEHVISNEKDCITIANKDYCNPPVEDIQIENFVYHPQYNNPRLAHDIALIRLARDINLSNSNMNAICLPIYNELANLPLADVLTAGWGLINTNTQSDILLKAKIPIVDRARCQKKYTGFSILESQICAGGRNGTDTCKGDSGGPIFETGKIHDSVRYVQFGVVAAGKDTCGADVKIPGLYIRISHYMKWILDQLKP